MPDYRLRAMKAVKATSRRRCHYCRVVLLPRGAKSRDALTSDHYVPKSAGGVRTVDCCVACNELKGDLMPDQWKAFTERYPDYRKQFRRHIDVRKALRDT